MKLIDYIETCESVALKICEKHPKDNRAKDLHKALHRLRLYLKKRYWSNKNAKK